MSFLQDLSNQLAIDVKIDINAQVQFPDLCPCGDNTCKLDSPYVPSSIGFYDLVKGNLLQQVSEIKQGFSAKGETLRCSHACGRKMRYISILRKLIYWGLPVCFLLGCYFMGTFDRFFWLVLLALLPGVLLETFYPQLVSLRRHRNFLVYEFANKEYARRFQIRNNDTAES